MPSTNVLLTGARRVIAVVRPYGRAGAALVAGLSITFVQDHSYAVGLAGILFVVAISLLVHDGPASAFNRITWWLSLVVFVLGVLGLALGKMSTSATLSLIMTLAAFETGLAIARSDRLWAWSTAVLVAALSLVYFTVPTESPMPAGLTGAWAIIAGVFEIIAVFDMHVKFARSKVGGVVTAAAKTAATTTAKAGAKAAKAGAKAGVAAAKAGAEATKRGAQKIGKARQSGSKR